ncbi:MAG TPA: hypothetical protein VMU50_12085, partial [Polyangia bacterium]|nr:hypothetical protein [Polyangia bacterium]
GGAAMTPAAALIAVAMAVGPALAGPRDTPPTLIEKRGAVTIDWAAGTVAAQAGAAADLRMPSADLARPGAERRARAVALDRLRAALGTLPLGGDRTLSPEAVERALGRARTVSVDYQSNGGVLLRVEVRFADWLAIPVSEAATATAPPPAAAITVPAAHLAASPVARVGKQEVVVGAATYRLGSAPSSARAIAARADRAGRLSMAGDARLAEKLAGALVVIYVERVNSR